MAKLRRRLFWLVFMWPCLMACQPEPPTLKVGRLSLSAPQPYDQKREDKEALRSAIESVLAQDDSVQWRPGKRGEHRIRVVIDRELSRAPSPVSAAQSKDAPKGGEQSSDAAEGETDLEDAAQAGAAIQMQWIFGITVEPADLRRQHALGTYQTTVALGEPASPTESELPSLAQLGPPAFAKGWQTIATMRRLAVAKDEKIVAEVQARAKAIGQTQAREERELFAFVLDEVGRRKLKGAMATLLPLLSLGDDGEHLALVLKVVGALVAIGDPQAVKPLTALTRRQPAGLVLQVVFAVSAIGGRTAEGFLVTLAGGHPDPRIQDGARRALEEMRVRQKRQEGKASN